METHNLNINDYGFEEILNLFNLTYNFTDEELKIAKKKVLFTHPDKSKLDPKYFLFYKKAFDLVLKYHEENKKQCVKVPTDKHLKYEKNDIIECNQIDRIIKKMDKTDFNARFNKLYEENMMKKIDKKKNEWFQDQQPVFDLQTADITMQNMGKAFETIKLKNGQMIKYRDVIEIRQNNFGTSLFDDNDGENQDDFSREQYITSDVFSKLKYDDLRKVHKDRTVFDVSEKDYDKVKKYNSVEHLSRERGSQNISPLDKFKAEEILMRKNEEFKKTMLEKHHSLSLKEMEYAEKNKKILATFLRIKNE
jgi:hypothetical protein